MQIQNQQGGALRSIDSSRALLYGWLFIVLCLAATVVTVASSQTSAEATCVGRGSPVYTTQWGYVNDHRGTRYGALTGWAPYSSTCDGDNNVWGNKADYATDGYYVEVEAYDHKARSAGTDIHRSMYAGRYGFPEGQGTRLKSCQTTGSRLGSGQVACSAWSPYSQGA